MIVYRKYGLRFGHVLHDNNFSRHLTDVVHIVMRKGPVPGAQSIPASTVTLRLDQPEESLRRALPETTAYEIRRAEREGTKCELVESVSATQLDDFLRFYQRFVNVTGNAPPDPHWLRILQAAGNLRLSIAKANDGEALVYHAYITGEKSCRLLHSISLRKEAEDNKERNLIGRANRLLHWEDILHFRSAGIELYDFGGWYRGKDNACMLGINRFKESFGGQVLFGSHCDLPLTMRGKAWLLLRGAIRTTRQWA